MVCLVFDVISLYVSQQGKTHRFGGVGMCVGHVPCGLSGLFDLKTKSESKLWNADVYLSLFCHVRGTCNRLQSFILEFAVLYSELVHYGRFS